MAKECRSGGHPLDKRTEDAGGELCYDCATKKEYLGDGVYAGDDGYSVVLTTEDGISVTNRIFLDPVVATNLIRFLARKYGYPWD